MSIAAKLWGIIGVNGAGKSTIIENYYRVLNPTEEKLKSTEEYPRFSNSAQVSIWNTPAFRMYTSTER